jgi:phage/plasmid primase-like uncharacterized protein
MPTDYPARLVHMQITKEVSQIMCEIDDRKEVDDRKRGEWREEV